MAEAVAKPDYRGCAFTRAGVEARPGSSVKAMCDESRAWSLALFADLAKQAGAADPDRAAQQMGPPCKRDVGLDSIGLDSVCLGR
jgi:hypothetical protein